MRFLTTLAATVFATLPLTALAQNGGNTIARDNRSASSSTNTGGLGSSGSSGNFTKTGSSGWAIASSSGGTPYMHNGVPITPSSGGGLPGGSGGWGSGGVWDRPVDYPNGGGDGGSSSDTPTQVPEPGTLALMGAGIAGLTAARRRRRNKS